VTAATEPDTLRLVSLPFLRLQVSGQGNIPWYGDPETVTSEFVPVKNQGFRKSCPQSFLKSGFAPLKSDKLEHHTHKPGTKSAVAPRLGAAGFRA
jgi:hypothetical protein